MVSPPKRRRTVGLVRPRNPSKKGQLDGAPPQRHICEGQGEKICPRPLAIGSGASPAAGTGPLKPPNPIPSMMLLVVAVVLLITGDYFNDSFCWPRWRRRWRQDVVCRRSSSDIEARQPNDDDPCITYSTVCVRSVVHESLTDYCGLTSAPSDDTSSRVAKYG